MNHSAHSALTARLPLAIPLFLAPLLFAAADFFWVGDAQYGLVAGTLLALGSAAWAAGFAAVGTVIRPHAPRIAGWGMLLAGYGVVCGGAAFAFQGVFNALYGISHDDALTALDAHPVVANLIFWIGGPAFPVTLLLLAVYILVGRQAPGWVGVTLAAGAVLFPVARIPRIELIAHTVDLLILIPIWYLAFAILLRGSLNLRSRPLPIDLQPEGRPAR